MPPAPTISALYVPTDSPSLSPSMGSAADPRSRDGPCSHHTSPQIVSKPAAPLRPCGWQAGPILLYGNTVADGPWQRAPLAAHASSMVLWDVVHQTTGLYRVEGHGCHT